MNYAFVDPTAINERLLNVIDKRLAEIPSLVPESPDLDSGDLLSDIGEYLLRSLAILSDISGKLADGAHVEEYVKQGIQDMNEESDLGDTELLDYMDSKHKSLR